MKKGTILIVDSDKAVRNSMEQHLFNEAEKIVTISSPNRIHEILSRTETDIVFLDANFVSAVQNGNEGMYWLREIMKYDSTISVVITAPTGDVEFAVKAIREGAADFVTKPFDSSRLLAAVSVAMQLRQSRLEASLLKRDNMHLKEVINSSSVRIVRGASPTMIRVMGIVNKVAPTDANVLITGENGTGKELVAREIHKLSRRSEEVMVSVDMGSVTETLFESELFGHVKGAFTDAREDRKGKIEAASNSTLFLDEIGNLSLQSQAKLLRVLQDREIVRVGENKPVPVNIRLICATNCDIDRMVREGRFREDLLYRINTIVIDVPPLRDRVDDIPILANHFLKIFAEKYGRDGVKISIHAIEKLANHDWPGNVRELQHAIEKAVIMSEGNVLKPSDFSFSTVTSVLPGSDMTLEEMEKKMILLSLKKYNSNMSVVAARLGITRQTLYNKISKYGL